MNGIKDFISGVLKGYVILCVLGLLVFGPWLIDGLKELGHNTVATTYSGAYWLVVIAIPLAAMIWFIKKFMLNGKK
jgi:branched-subunit amino acid permease